MITQKLKSLFNILGKICLGLIGVISLSFAILFYILTQGPISLEPFQETFSKKFEKLVPDFSIRFHHPELNWSKIDHCFKIKVQQLEIQSINTKKTQASIKQLTLIYSLNNLLKLEFYPEGIDIDAPKLTFKRNEDITQIIPVEISPKEDFLLSLFHQLLQNKSFPLQFIQINQAKIVIEDPYAWGTWAFPETNIKMISEGQNFELNAKTIWNNENYSCHVKYSQETKEGFLSVSLPYLSTEILKLIQEKAFITLPDNTQKIIRTLQEQSLNFSLKAQGYYTAETGIRSGFIDFNLFKGIVKTTDILPKNIKINQAQIQAHIHNNHLTFDKFNINTDKGNLNISGVGDWIISDKKFKYNLKTGMDSFSIQSLKEIWPSTLAPQIRAWLNENIKQADIPKFECTMLGEIFLTSLGVQNQIHRLQGEMIIKNGSLSYINSMPLVTNIQAKSSFNQQNFKIEIQQAQSAGLNLNQGHVVIQGLDQKDQTLELNSNIQGSLESALKFLSSPALHLKEKFDLSQFKAKGIINTKLKIMLPLEKVIKENEIKIEAQSQISEIFLKVPSNAVNLFLTKGSCNLSLTPDALLIEGQGLLNQVLSQFTLHQQLSSAPRTQASIKMSLTPLFLKKAGIDPFPYFSTGEIPIQVTYEGQPLQNTTLNIKADLTSAKLSYLDWHKTKQKEGHLISTILLYNNHPRSIKTFSVTSGKDVNISLKANFDQNGKKLTSAQILNFKLGPYAFKGQGHQDIQGKYHISISGTYLDLGPFIKNMSSSKSITLPNINVLFEAKFDKIQLSEQQLFYNNALTLNYEKNKVQLFKFRTYLKHLQRPEDLIHIMLAPFKGPHKRRFTLQTPAAGKLLKGFDFPLQIHDGNLQLYAICDDQKAPEKWQGKMRIQNFSIKNAPILGKILALTFPTGVLDLFSPKGLPMQQFRTEFCLTSQKIMLRKGRAQGSSLGMTLKGSMKRDLSEINLSGSVIPGYLLNSLFARIPIIGEILTGGRHEGLFSASYAIRGSQQNPKISVNPITFLTPGFLRNIFDIFSPHEENEEENDFIDRKD